MEVVMVVVILNVIHVAKAHQRIPWTLELTIFLPAGIGTGAGGD
jgi:TRAP-type C4-dicarboxylate transport system permease small subunit